MRRATYVGQVPSSIRFRGAVYRMVAAGPLPATIKFRGAVYEIDAAAYRTPKIEYTIVFPVNPRPDITDKYDAEFFEGELHGGLEEIFNDREVRAKILSQGPHRSKLYKYEILLSEFNTGVLQMKVRELFNKLGIAADSYTIDWSRNPRAKPNLSERQDDAQRVLELKRRIRELEYKKKLKEDKGMEDARKQELTESVEEGMQKRRQHWTF